MLYKMILAIIVAFVATLGFGVSVSAEVAGINPPIPPDGVLCEEIGVIAGFTQYATLGGALYYREMGKGDFTANKPLPAGTKVRGFDADSDNPTIITYTHTVTGVVQVMVFATENNEWSDWDTLQTQSTHFTIGRLFHHVSTALCFLLPTTPPPALTDLEIWAGIDNTTYGLPSDAVEPAAGPVFPVGTVITLTTIVYNRSDVEATGVAASVGNQLFVSMTLQAHSFIELHRTLSVEFGETTLLVQVIHSNILDVDSNPGDGLGDESMTITYTGFEFVPPKPVHLTYIPLVWR